MKTKMTLQLVLAGNFLALLLIYLPYVFHPLESLEILAPGIYNLFLLAGEFVICLLISLIPMTRRFAGAWWLAWGLLLLLSFPACLATAWINQYLAN